MLGTALVGCVLALLPTVYQDGLGDVVAAEYQSKSKAAGRDADAQVRLALWCESKGLLTERSEHLALAVLVDPNHAQARALLGQVKDKNGVWVSAEPLASARENPARKEYEQRRASIRDTADAHWQLALWCEQNGLAEEARAHLTRVTWLEPKRDAAWRRLGCKKVDGRWMTDAEAQHLRTDREAQQAANHLWTAKLKKLKDQLGDDRKRAAAQAELAQVNDPRAVPAVWATFVADRRPNLPLAIQILGQTSGQSASRALAMLVFSAPNEEVRRQAIESLRQRDPREFADMFISMIQKPLRFDVVRSVDGPGSSGELLIEGKKMRVRRIYPTPDAPRYMPMPGDRLLGFDDDGLPIVARDAGFTESGFVPVARGVFDSTQNQAQNQAQFQAQIAEIQNRAALAGATPQAVQGLGLIEQLGTRSRQGNGGFTLPGLSFGAAIEPGTDRGNLVNYLYHRDLVIPVGAMEREALNAVNATQDRIEQDLQLLKAYNQATSQRNELALSALRAVSDIDFGDDHEAWARWYVGQLGLAIQAQRIDSRPEPVVEVVPPEYIPQPIPIGAIDQVVSYQIRHSCFGAGTPVHTRDGLRPIEDIRVGDVVLAMDTNSGTLSYQPVISVHHNPPSPTFDLKSGGETIVTSTYHRFWVPSEGWKMARELAASEPLRALHGRVAVESREDGQVQPVFNLQVAGAHTFFVGKQALLVHDNSLPEDNAAPFDRVK